MECLGCKLANGVEPGVQVVYENDRIAACLDIAPFNEGHLLLLPKAHVHEHADLPEETLVEMMRASVQLSRIIQKLYAPDGITLCQNGGQFNDLGHYHMHIIPRYNGDGFTWSEPVIEHGAGERLQATRARMINEINATQAYKNLFS